MGSAAQKLRRWAEMYFAEACKRLGARVVFRQDGRWELRHLMPPAIQRLSELNAKAKDSANSWNDDSRRKELGEFGDNFRVAVARTQAEQWVINPSVHYNAWLDLSGQDFSDVSQAFHDLIPFFECSNCGAILSLEYSNKPTSVRCSCSNINWNLETKPKT